MDVSFLDMYYLSHLDKVQTTISFGDCRSIPSSIKALLMLSCVSTRIHPIKLGTKETKTFGTASKFYTVLLIFQTLDISDA